MLVREAVQITGGLSVTDKMPCDSHGIPARECNVGSRLVKVKGSTCHGCYALKGRYAMPTTERAGYRRLHALGHPEWIDAMVTLVARQKSGHFRWFDSGDLQSLDHLRQIMEVIKATPHIQHWLPSREYKLLDLHKALHGDWPANVVVRRSAHLIDGPPPKTKDPTSTVVTDDSKVTCRAPWQGNQCLDCRDCWNPTVRNVAYRKH